MERRRVVWQRWRAACCKLLAGTEKHKAAIAQIDDKLRHFKNGDVFAELKDEAAWEGVPAMPVQVVWSWSWSRCKW